MRQRDGQFSWGRTLAASVWTLLLVRLWLGSGDLAADPPNVIVILADDQSFETIAALGHPQIQTPQLDQLVRRGLSFTRAYNMGSWSGAVCVASRTMLNTGRFLWHAQSLHNTLASDRVATPLWSQRLRRAGYRTYFSGKWHLNGSPQDAFEVARHIRPGMPNQTPAGYDRPREGTVDAWSPSDPTIGGYWQGGRHWSEVLADDALAFLQDASTSDAPFFLYLAFNAPHDPRQSPQAFVDRYPAGSIEIPVNFLPEYPFKVRRMMSTAWQPLVGPFASLLRDHSASLDQMSRGEIPAVVFQQAYSREDCQSLIDRLLDRRLMYDPAGEIPESFVEQTIPEGYFRRGDALHASRSAQSGTAARGHRIDVGTSLGYRGSDRFDYFTHAAQTRQLFADLFRELRNPVQLLYDSLQSLAPSHQVLTAVEPDGAQYGPAIFRIHYGNYSYPPHFDSVRLREARQGYAVFNYEHQFAAVLVLQNAVAGETTAQCVLHRRRWTEDLDPVLQAGEFHEYARQHEIPSFRVELEPGDLYFFNTRYVHEVPGVAGDLPRIVLAAFVGYSPHEPQIMVWG
jgi:hypothetical protein